MPPKPQSRPGHRGQTGPTHRSGSVLVAVLAIILLLSFIITRFVDEAIDDLEYRAIFNEPADVRSFTYSMLEVALATIHEVALIDEGKLYAPEQGWGEPLDYAGIRVPNGWELSISIQDESGRLPINTMDEADLNRMLEESFDFDFGTARELSSMLLDWIDPDDNRRLNGAESEDYLRRNPPYRAANRPLQNLRELRLIEVWEDEFFDPAGRPNELFRQLDSMVSVLHNAPANLNSSPQAVLELLALQSGFDERALFDGLGNLPYLLDLPAAANGETSGVEVSLLRVTVSLKRGQIPFTVSALVEPSFEAESSAAGRAAPGSASEDAPKTGAPSEQAAIQYPFRIIELSEYAQAGPEIVPGRYSALDMERESGSF